MTTTPSAQAEPLRPCPFCGNEAVVNHIDAQDDWWVSCNECQVQRPSVKQLVHSREEAIAAWNTRAFVTKPLTLWTPERLTERYDYWQAQVVTATMACVQLINEVVEDYEANRAADRAALTAKDERIAELELALAGDKPFVNMLWTNLHKAKATIATLTADLATANEKARLQQETLEEWQRITGEARKHMEDALDKNTQLTAENERLEAQVEAGVPSDVAHTIITTLGEMKKTMLGMKHRFPAKTVDGSVGSLNTALLWIDSLLVNQEAREQEAQRRASGIGEGA